MKRNKARKKSSQRHMSFRLTDGQELVYGRHVIVNLINDGVAFSDIFLDEDLSKQGKNQIIELTKSTPTKVTYLKRSELDELTDGGLHQGYVAVMPAYSYSSLEEAFSLARNREEDPFFLILDGIEDPHNLGAIIRTAEAVGVHGLIIPKHRAASVNATVLKVSTGAAMNINIIQVTNLTDTINTLKERSVWVFASDMAGEDMREWNSTGPIALVIGNEGKGVSRLVKENCDGVVTIPMVGKVESLNASVAAAVLMYEVARDRMPKGNQS